MPFWCENHDISVPRTFDQDILLKSAGSTNAMVLQEIYRGKFDIETKVANSSQEKTTFMRKETFADEKWVQG